MGLQVDPELGCRAEIAPQTQSRVGRYGTPAKDAKPRGDYPPGTVPAPEGVRLNGVQGDVSFEQHQDGRWRSINLIPDQPFTVQVDGAASEKLTLKEGDAIQVFEG